MKVYIFILYLLGTGILYSQDLQGAVVDENLNTIPFARIRIVESDIILYSDSAGYFEIEDLQHGHYNIEISAIGFHSSNFEIHFDGQVNPIRFKLNKSHRELDKVIISTDGVLQGENITNVEYRDMSEITKIPGTLGESLANIPGVNQSSTGTGISKPVIRGLSGNRVVTYLNGLRIENQQWGGDHGLPVTDLGIGHVEVIKGPSSLLYGSDAIGGVLYFADDHYTAINNSEGFIQSRFDLNSLGTSNQGGIKISGGRLKINLYGEYDQFADYQMGNDLFVINSRYSQYSGKMALGYSRKKWLVNFRYNYYHAEIGIPGHTHDSIPDPLDFMSISQGRAFAISSQIVDNHYSYLENKFFLNDNVLTVSIGNTFNRLKEHEEKITIPDINLLLNTTNYNFRFKSRLLDHTVDLITGIQGMNQVNKNDPDAPELLIPDAWSHDLGAYLVLSGKYKKWRIQSGMRYDYRYIETTSDISGSDLFSSSYSGFNYSAGAAWISDKATFRANISTGFRAPHTSELLSDGVHHGSRRYEIGDSNLKTEHATQYDLSFGIHREDLEIIINPFYTLFRDYIQLERVDSVIDGMDVFQYSQAGKAQLYGGDLGIHYHPHFAHRLHLETSLSTVFAEDENKAPLSRIPQTGIRSEIRYLIELGKFFMFEEFIVQHYYAFKQNRLGPLETETSSYNLINVALNMSLNFSQTINISIGARNLLNESYFDHLSNLKILQLENQGLNIYFNIKYQFNQNKNQ